MAKKKSGLNLVNVIAVVVGILAVILFILLPMVKVTIGSEGNQMVSLYKGFGMIFGGTVNSDVTTTITVLGTTTTSTDTVEIKEVAFNTMAFFSLLLVVLGTLATSMVTFAKSLKGNKLFTFIAGALLVVGGILMFTVKGSSITALDASGGEEYFKLGIGAIIAAIMSITAGSIVILQPVLKK